MQAISLWSYETEKFGLHRTYIVDSKYYYKNWAVIMAIFYGALKRLNNS